MTRTRCAYLMMKINFWAVQVPSGQEMLSGRLFEQMVVSTSGDMAMMRTLHPLDFVRIKRPKDLLQAGLVQHLWSEWLCYRQDAAPS